MSSVIDRRLNGKNKSSANRERFLKRYKDKVKKSVTDSIKGRSITDIGKGGDVSIQKGDIDEPYFGHSDGGERDTVIPGNDSYHTGDQIRRPRRGGKGSTAGEGDPFDDEFAFTLTKEEFLQYFFEDMELPDLVKKELSDPTETKMQRAGYTSSGCTSNLHVLRSLRGAIGRRIGMGGKTARLLEETQIAYLAEKNEVKASALLDVICHLQAKLNAITFLDPIDLRYRNSVVVPAPSSKAVMFCVMDVSGSMGEFEKDIAKRFFILLYLFLTKNYEKIELVFIRHTTEAKEVSEHEFFYGKESGGTRVSSAITLMADIIQERYSESHWNIYGAQLSDGDNISFDSPDCAKILSKHILPAVQYFAYVEIGAQEPQSLWFAYQELLETHTNFAVKSVTDVSRIYPVFTDLFKRKAARNE